MIFMYTGLSFLDLDSVCVSVCVYVVLVGVVSLRCGVVTPVCVCVVSVGVVLLRGGDGRTVSILRSPASLGAPGLD